MRLNSSEEQCLRIPYIEEWFEILSSNKRPYIQLEELLAYLGELFQAERSYIFEWNKDGTFTNTYEWCAEGICSQKDTLKNENLDDWLDTFRRGECILIEDIEEIREGHSSIYAILKPQDISSLVVIPIFICGELSGFLGFDNLKTISKKEMIPTMMVASDIFSCILKVIQLADRVEYLTFHDELTKQRSRRALFDDYEKLENPESFGIVYLDITNLRKVNTDMGLAVGDELIIRCGEVLSAFFYNYKTYRVAGDEFVVLLPNIQKETFDNLLINFDQILLESDLSVSLGTAFIDDCADIAELVAMAERNMSSKKETPFVPSIEAERSSEREVVVEDVNQFSLDKNLLLNFVEKTNIGLDSLFSFIAETDDSYHYIGDLRQDLWYLSDSMRDTWGFESNIIHDLPGKWAEFITNETDRTLYQDNMEDMWAAGKCIHDLVYRVHDPKGDEHWIRCYGHMTWDDNEPVSFCGNISKLNNTLEVDPVSKYMKEEAALKRIVTLYQNQSSAVYICFKFNNFSDINQINGREESNRFISNITSTIKNTYSGGIAFYRLDGLRFLAILQTEDTGYVQEIARGIQQIVSDIYVEKNIFVKVPCSVGVIYNYENNIDSKKIMNGILNMYEQVRNTSDIKVMASSELNDTYKVKKQMMMALNKDASGMMDNFRVVVQPIVSAETGKIISGEVLLRWRYKGKDVSPVDFIPKLESNNLIVPVGRWVFEQAAKICKRARSYLPDFFIDFNVSYNQTGDETFSDYIKETLDRLNLEGNSMVLELTESHYDDAPVKLKKLADSCQRLGLRMALDDFGVGYSSLEMLFKYPSDIIKLDKSILKKMSDDDENSKFVSTIIYSCHQIGKIVCVEGVETEKELNMVKETGVNMVQGYYFYKPMELEDFYNLLSKDE